MAAECRVASVEYRMNARLSSGRVYADGTEATVITPFGRERVVVAGYHVEPGSYPFLICRALDQCWARFCDAR